MFAVTAISNPARYHSRYNLYSRFREMMEASGVPLITVELALGDRPFEVTEAGNPHHLQLRSVEEYWHKECMLNLGIAHGRRVIAGAKRVAWIDADCRSARMPREWMEETWHELQHYEFVQMWEWIQHLDHAFAPLCPPTPSFMANYQKHGSPYPRSFAKDAYSPAAVSWGSPGLAWAANLDALDKIGGLPDYAILGAGDWYLAHMLISDLPVPEFQEYTAAYRDKFVHQQTLCERWVRRDVGFVRGLVYHDFHGKTKNRGYSTRERILIDGQYNPHTDIKRDHQGLYQLETYEPRQIAMRDQIRAYMRARNEDDVSA